MSENGVVKLMRAWREGFRAVPMEECDDDELEAFKRAMDAGAQARSDALIRGILEDAP